MRLRLNMIYKAFQHLGLAPLPVQTPCHVGSHHCTAQLPELYSGLHVSVCSCFPRLGCSPLPTPFPHFLLLLSSYAVGLIMPPSCRFLRSQYCPYYCIIFPYQKLLPIWSLKIKVGPNRTMKMLTTPLKYLTQYVSMYNHSLFSKCRGMAINLEMGPLKIRLVFLYHSAPCLSSSFTLFKVGWKLKDICKPIWK